MLNRIIPILQSNPNISKFEIERTLGTPIPNNLYNRAKKEAFSQGNNHTDMEGMGANLTIGDSEKPPNHQEAIENVLVHDPRMSFAEVIETLGYQVSKSSFYRAQLGIGGVTFKQKKVFLLVLKAAQELVSRGKKLSSLTTVDIVNQSGLDESIAQVPTILNSRYLKSLMHGSTEQSSSNTSMAARKTPTSLPALKTAQKPIMAREFAPSSTNTLEDGIYQQVHQEEEEESGYDKFEVVALVPEGSDISTVVVEYGDGERLIEIRRAIK